LEGCDNCETRFNAMSEAFSGEASTASKYLGIPDLSTVDVIVAQELGTTPDKYTQITAVLYKRGFVYTSGAPSPVAADAQCSDPPGFLFDQTGKGLVSKLTGLESGGLITFSKHPIVKTVKHNWCAHTLPAPAGYLLTLLDVGQSRQVAVFNLHMMPEYTIAGIKAEDVRAYQFSEVSSLADKLSAEFKEAGVSYSVVFGGDFNEDIYGMSSTSDQVQCDLVTSASAKSKFARIGIDLDAACDAGKIGKPTWDPTNNDLARRFSSNPSKHEALDLLVQHSSSTAATEIARNTVHVLRTTDEAAWSGTFCDDSTRGVLGETRSGTATALTDHNAVTAVFPLPLPSTSTTVGGSATIAVDSVMSSWIGQVAAASCGQTGVICAIDGNCCNADYSWTGTEQHCSAFECKDCTPKGSSCQFQMKGSSCCGYDDYSSGSGTHCEFNWGSTSTCIPKHAAGAKCWFDGECQSQRCEWEWGWWSSGYRCQ